MTWHMYRIIFRLRSPLHIGWNKIGNVQRTRSYVTGRSLWGAITMRMTRDQAHRENRATNAEDYRKMGDDIHKKLAYTYLYPATRQTDASIAFPWEASGESFNRRFLSSYASTALTYPAQSATEGTLHEVEFLSPLTIDTGEPVYLMGYLFVHEDMRSHVPALEHTLHRLQIGGERNYGWGRLNLVTYEVCTEKTLFNAAVSFQGDHERPRITLDKEQQRLLAHTRVDVDKFCAQGELEPLVGREWRTTVGQYVACNGVCFAPGATIQQPCTFEIKEYGVWEWVS